MADVNQIFRLRLEAEMKAQGLNPASLSKRAQMNRRAVQDLLEGRAQSPKLSTAYNLAKALSVTLDMLTGDAPQKAIAPKLLEILSQYDQAEQEQLAEAILRLPRSPGSEQ
ncbi:helix-turn-helix domain-containing protein [Paracoccus kondratievae]|uniref:helix-turn-helix domain-containing protein n=1 Tax=Paracoccus kondratievae TaxID=135740 RepID=UPI0012664C3D|nr:helix-turn-helix transcriptional regulator [Paracoccus kondratievae]QFQ87334.1 helix-turn-helix domain-containing protein [Paracoccus kondratievae]